MWVCEADRECSVQISYRNPIWIKKGKLQFITGVILQLVGVIKNQADQSSIWLKMGKIGCRRMGSKATAMMKKCVY